MLNRKTTAAVELDAAAALDLLPPPLLRLVPLPTPALSRNAGLAALLLIDTLAALPALCESVLQNCPPSDLEVMLEPIRRTRTLLEETESRIR